MESTAGGEEGPAGQRGVYHRGLQPNLRGRRETTGRDGTKLYREIKGAPWEYSVLSEIHSFRLMLGCLASNVDDVWLRKVLGERLGE